MKGKWTALPLSVQFLSVFLFQLNFAGAEEIGYWRFEPGALTADSGKYGLNLEVTKESPPSEFALPSVYEGAKFPATIPQNQEKNAGAAQFTEKGCFYRQDDSRFSVSTAFTIEALIKSDEISATTRFIAGQFNKGDRERAWFFAIQNGQLRMSTSADGTATIAQDSSFEELINQRDDYYVAAAYNAGSVTFYLMNLSENGPLLTSVIDGFSETIYDAPSQFRIGAFGTQAGVVGRGFPGNFFSGIIDEVRLSNTALSTKNLLISTPDLTLAGTPAN